MYRKIVARSFGGPEVLKIEELAELPEPGDDQVRVRVEAAGVGYTDTILRRGRYVNYKGGLPLTPGYDVVGVVDKLGSEVTGLTVGQRVADMPVHGAYSEYLVCEARDLVPVPDGIDAAVAVEVPLMWMTAWQMLTRCVSLPSASTVLVVGATGAVGRALVVLGNHLGLRTIATCSAANIARAESQGVATAIDYRRPDLPSAIREASGGRGVDAAFDAVGGSSWQTSWRSLAPGGTLVGYGFQDFLESGAANRVALVGVFRLNVFWPLLGKLDRTRRRAVSYDISKQRHKEHEEYAEDAKTLLRLIADGQVLPPTPEVLPLDAAAEAHRRIASGGLQGRLVLRP